MSHRLKAEEDHYPPTRVHFRPPARANSRLGRAKLVLEARSTTAKRARRRRGYCSAPRRGFEKHWHLKVHVKGKQNENCNLARSSFTWANLRRVWPKWLLEFSQQGADADRIGGTIHRRALSVALLLRCRWATNRRRRSVARKSVPAFGSGAAWTS